MTKLDKLELNRFKREIKIKYSASKDKDNSFGVGITDAEFREYIIGILSGRHWHQTYILSQEQTNELALYNILNKLDKKWRKRK